MFDVWVFNMMELFVVPEENYNIHFFKNMLNYVYFVLLIKASIDFYQSQVFLLSKLTPLKDTITKTIYYLWILHTVWK